MSDRNRRMKASDVHNNTTYFADLFGPRVSFKQSFPEIQVITVWVEETNFGEPVGRGPSVYTIDTMPGPYINCHNPRCYNGGFSLERLVQCMIATKQTHFEGSEACQGYEGSPKGRRRDQDCDHRFRVKIDITYASEDQDSPNRT